MPKLMQIVVEGNTGSTGTIAEEIGIRAIKHGWESYIAHARFPRPSKSHIRKIGNVVDILFHGLMTRIFDMHGLGSLRATKKLVQKIKKINPDVVQLHHLHGYYINIQILFEYLSKSGIPVFWTFHDCWAFTGHCTYYSYVGCDKWKDGCHHCPQTRQYPASLIFDRSEKNYIEKKYSFTSVSNMTIISVSRWLDNQVSQSFLSGLNRKIIYNGVDTEIFKPITGHKLLNIKRLFDFKYIILGVASPWSDRKGLSDFLALSERLPKDVGIVLVGLDNTVIKKLPANIIGLERVNSRSALAELYNYASVFLNLSEEETFGLTTAEALACGTPVIVYNATASPEIVDNRTGLIVEKNNIDQLLQSVKIIIGHGRNHYSSFCRDRVLKKFNKENNYLEYINMYSDSCKKV
jgi:putative colanic acid biosynthesis glycosyltransferase